MSLTTSCAPPRFSGSMRFFHWLVAAVVLTMLGIGVSMVASLADYHRLLSIHRPLGVLVLILVVLRYVNRRFSTLPPFPETMSGAERSAASASELVLYALLLAQPLVGWAMLSAARYPIVLFGPVHLFPILPHSLALYAGLRKAHTVLAFLLFLMFLGHFSAVLFHTLVIRDGLLYRMAPWRRRMRHEERGVSSRGRELATLTPAEWGRTMIHRYSGAVVLVAGGTGGLGRYVSLAFLEEGASVVSTYRSPSELEALRQAAGANSSKLDAYQVDVTSDVETRQMVSSVVAKHGSLDVLVNAVGGYAAGSKLWDTEPTIFDRMLALNLYSGYFLARNVVPFMLKRRRGAIVNVASMAAIDHAAASAAYAASKAASVAMIDSFAADLKGTGVRVNSILPSIIDTEENRKAMPAADFSKWPKPQDIAQVILFLCSDAAKLIHGAAIPL